MTMKKMMSLLALLTITVSDVTLGAHCQLPCGIYHDEVIFGRIDQYVETMYKGVSVLKTNKFNDPKDRNEFVRWVMQKDQASDEAANLILKYFLQQKMKPGDEDTTKQLISAHKLLFLTVSIKQGVDLQFVEDFSDEWEKFKLMFHLEGYVCDMAKIKMQKERARRAAAGLPDHDHEHDHAEEVKEAPKAK